MREIIEHNVIQGSPEWHELRRGRITASEAGDFLGTEMAFNKLLYKKAAEILTGNVETIKSSPKMERGHDMEPRSRVLFEMKHGVKINQPGFFAVDEFFGVSPDGTYNGKHGWENKAINQTDHLQLHETGDGCKDHENHKKQCLFSLYFLEYIDWTLCYYHNLFPDKYCLKEFPITLDEKVVYLIKQRETAAVEFLTKYKKGVDYE